MRLAILAACFAAASASWVNTERAAATTPMTVRIALARQNLDAVAREVELVSDTRSSRYTSFRSMEELRSFSAPTAASSAAVSSFLDSRGLSYTADAHSIVVDATVADVESLFSTEVFMKVNDETMQAAVRADVDTVTVPAAIAAHVDAVFGVEGLPLPPRHLTIVQGADFAQVTPSVINSAYKVSGVTPTGSDKNRQAIAEFQGQLLSQKDLTTFFTKYVPSKTSDDQVYAYKGDKMQGEGVEANLDIQYIMGVAPGVKTEAWQYAGQDFCADLKQWTTEIIADNKGPNVHSVSYGWQGPLAQIGCSNSQVSSIDADFATIAAAGVSIIFASGDSGSGQTGEQLYASWPASSQYVTAVGATGFQSGAGSAEQATTQFGSGGGFSRVVTPAPAWQASAISTFNSEEGSKLPPSSSYNAAGRGTPDVSALGEGFQVIIDGNPSSVGGTSAAAPTFAALVSLVNEARIQAGKAPMGLLNKFIYQNAGAFTDITVGSNRISRSGFPVKYGFDAVAGWDAATGMGTVNFPAFLAAAMKA